MTAILLFLAYAYVLWLLFLAVMALMHARDRMTLPRGTLILAAPAIVVAVVLDIGLNVVASLPFWDKPRELTFSQRMGRYKKGDSWRAPIARWICSNLLDPFQIGGHCR